jgi:translation initiation factor IF-1
MTFFEIYKRACQPSIQMNPAPSQSHMPSKGNNRPQRRPASGGNRPRPGGPSSGPRPVRPIQVSDDPEGAVEVEGMIVQVLAGTMFKVELSNKHVVLAHISGKMRKRFIKLVIGDRVRMEMSPYDTTKARITFRL